MSHDRRAVVNSDYPALEKVADLAIKEKQKFERLVVPKETLLEMFGVRLLYTRIYWNGASSWDEGHSTTSTRNISSRPRFPTEPPLPYTAAGRW